MGIDFIRRTSGKPYMKRWASGLDRTKTPTLIDIRLPDESRTLTATLVTPDAARPGSTVIVQATGTDLVVFDGLKQIARISNAPADVQAALAGQQGMAPAVVERISALGGTVEVRLK
jgi:hypothetical protein